MIRSAKNSSKICDIFTQMLIIFIGNQASRNVVRSTVGSAFEIVQLSVWVGSKLGQWNSARNVDLLRTCFIKIG